MTDGGSSYVSRAGLKLAAALEAFELDIRGWTCVDFGSHTGGFVDCLLRHGATCVHAVDPGYGILDYRLRRDPRVVVHERTNALEFASPERVPLVTCDVGWTPQRLVLPAARRCLRDPDGQVITLVKPQYEAPQEWLRGGILPDERIDDVLASVRQDVAGLGLRIAGELLSPLRGHGGNREFLWWLCQPGSGPSMAER